MYFCSFTTDAAMASPVSIPLRSLRIKSLREGGASSAPDSVVEEGADIATRRFLSNGVVRRKHERCAWVIEVVGCNGINVWLGFTTKDAAALEDREMSANVRRRMVIVARGNRSVTFIGKWMRLNQIVVDGACESDCTTSSNEKNEPKGGDCCDDVLVHCVL